MPTTNTEGVLVYTNESRGFRYVEGNYELIGNIVSQGGVVKSVDGGGVQKDGQFIGNFNVRYENAVPMVSLNSIAASDSNAICTAVSNLLTKLAE